MVTSHILKFFTVNFFCFSCKKMLKSKFGSARMIMLLFVPSSEDSIVMWDALFYGKMPYSHLQETSFTVLTTLMTPFFIPWFCLFVFFATLNNFPSYNGVQFLLVEDRTSNNILESHGRLYAPCIISNHSLQCFMTRWFFKNGTFLTIWAHKHRTLWLGAPFEHTWIPIAQWYVLPSLVEIGLEKKLKMWKVYRLTDDRQTNQKTSHELSAIVS